MIANWWGISASIVAWLGVAVIALAIIGPWIKQRIKRRRRCPKCWYDMSHSPGMTCSECGFAAKRERKLYKAHRRWKLAFLGVFMLIGAYALNVTPAVKDRGWIAAVPTSALICAVPFMRPNFQIAAETRWWRELAAGRKQTRLTNRLYIELVRNRIANEDHVGRLHGRLIRVVCRLQNRDPEYGSFIWDDHRSRLIATTRWAREPEVLWSRGVGTPEYELPSFQTRAVWPVGVPIGAHRRYGQKGASVEVTWEALGLEPDDVENRWRPRLAPKVPIPGPHDVRLLRVPWLPVVLGVARQPMESITLRFTVREWQIIRDTPVRRYRLIEVVDVPLATRVVERIEEVITPQRVEAIDELLRSAEPKLVLAGTGFHRGPYIDLKIDIHALAETVCAVQPLTLALRAEVIIAGDIVAKGHGRIACDEANMQHLIPGRRAAIRLAVRGGDLAQAAAEETPMTLRLYGDAASALTDFDATHYWEGEIIRPLTPPSRSHPDTHPGSR